MLAERTSALSQPLSLHIFCSDIQEGERKLPLKGPSWPWYIHLGIHIFSPDTSPRRVISTKIARYVQLRHTQAARMDALRCVPVPLDNQEMGPQLLLERQDEMHASTSRQQVLMKIRLRLLVALVRTTCAFSSRRRLMQALKLMHVGSDGGNCVLQQRQTWCPFTTPRHSKWLGKTMMMVSLSSTCTGNSGSSAAVLLLTFVQMSRVGSI